MGNTPPAMDPFGLPSDTGGKDLGVFLPIANTVTGSNMGALVLQAVLQVIVAVAVIGVAGSQHLSRTESVQMEETRSSRPNPISPSAS